MFKSEDEYTILEKFAGVTLKGKTYKPIFDYFAHLKSEGAFRVLCDTYVTEESGTGIVHQVIHPRLEEILEIVERTVNVAIENVEKGSVSFPLLTEAANKRHYVKVLYAFHLNCLLQKTHFSIIV